jgi:hypothetical protein
MSIPFHINFDSFLNSFLFYSFMKMKLEMYKCIEVLYNFIARIDMGELAKPITAYCVKQQPPNSDIYENSIRPFIRPSTEYLLLFGS